MFRRIATSLSLVCLLLTSAHATEVEERLRTLEERSAKQQKQIEDQNKTIQELTGQVNTAKPETTPPPAPGASSLFGGAALTNPYLSMIVNTYAYGSSIDQGKLEDRGIPGYTRSGIDRRKGFNLDAAELAVFAPVDPYFNLYAIIPIAEDGAEVEEAYFITTDLPAGLQVKGGKFKSGFGRINAQHPHAWDFVDIPLIYRAFLGDEGYSDKGAQLTYLPPLPLYVQFGAEVLQGDNDQIFGQDAKQRPHAFAGFVKASVDVGDASTLLFGPSVLVGNAKNDSLFEGRTFEGMSRLYGAELTYKWKPSRHQSAVVQSEYFYLNQDGHLDNEDLSGRDKLRRDQDGLYVQALYQWERWRVGARYDRLDLFQDKVELAGDKLDPGTKPWRVTGALEFNPSEFSRIRLQCSHDRSARDAPPNNEVFLQFLFGIGAHAAHQF